MEKHAVAWADEMEPGSVRLVAVAGIEIGLFAVDGGYRAYRNLCPHAGAPVCEGEVTGETLRCPWHAWEFDLTTGRLLGHPECGLESFPVEVSGGQLVVSI